MAAAFHSPLSHVPFPCCLAGLTALLLRQRWLLRLAGFHSVSEAEPEVAEEMALHAMGRHTAVDRREAVSAGAGAGIAAAFGKRA